MTYVALRQVPYRPIGTSRMFWAFVLLQREGLTLLWVQNPSLKGSSFLVIATENVNDRVFEDAPGTCRFPTAEEDLGCVGERLGALGEKTADVTFRKYFRFDDDKDD